MDVNKHKRKESRVSLILRRRRSGKASCVHHAAGRGGLCLVCTPLPNIAGR